MESTPLKIHKQQSEMAVPFLPVEQVMEMKHLNQLSSPTHISYPTDTQIRD